MELLNNFSGLLLYTHANKLLVLTFQQEEKARVYAERSKKSDELKEMERKRKEREVSLWELYAVEPVMFTK